MNPCKKIVIFSVFSNLATAAFAQDTVVDLGTIILEGESDTTIQQEGYVASAGRQATKVETPVKEIPQSISIITLDQIEGQAPRTANETLTYTASADVYSFGFDNRFDAFNLRGFPAYYDGVFRDGLRQYNAPTALYKNEPYGLEAMTVLKGPASSLYGASGPGGIANMVSKRPLDDRYREVRLGFGLHNRKEIAGDFSGPLNDAGTLKYRLTGLLRDSDTHLEGFKDDKLYIAPALEFGLGADTTVTLLSEYSRSVTGGTAGYFNSAPGVASDLYSGDPNYNDFLQKQWRFGYEVEHRFSDTVTLRNHFRHSDVDADLQYSGWYPAGGSLARYWGHYAEQMSATTMDTMLEIRAQTGGIDHDILVGFDVTQSEYTSAGTLGYVSAAATAATPLAFAGSLKMDQQGVYLHDQMSWGNWRAFASVRFDHVDVRSLSAANEARAQGNNGTSMRLGLSYTMDNGLTLYSNVASSFLPVPQLVYDDIFQPETRPGTPTEALQKEIGLKYQLPGTNSLFSVSLFDIDADNQLILDASNGGVNRARQVNMRSRGIELEGVANWDNGWGMIGSFTHQDVTFPNSDPSFPGNNLNAVPKNIGALWVSYGFQSGAAKGLTIGAGLRHVGKSYGDDANTLVNGSKNFIDLGLSYDLQQYDGVRLQVNVRNLADKREQTCASSYCYRDEGRMITLNLTRKF